MRTQLKWAFINAEIFELVTTVFVFDDSRFLVVAVVARAPSKFVIEWSETRDGGCKDGHHQFCRGPED